VRHGREGVEQQRPAGRGEVDAAAHHDVVDAAVGTDETRRREILLRPDHPRWTVTTAAVEPQPRPVVQDGHIARSEQHGAVDAVGGQPGVAARHSN
jgi:hypothetical protein